MPDLQDKTALVTGIANHRSIAFAIAEELARQSARVAVAYQPLGRERELERIEELVAPLGKPLLLPLDVTDPASCEAAFAAIKQELGGLDVLVHSIAGAKREELGGRFSDTSLEGYLLAQKISAYSLIELARWGRAMLAERQGSIVALSYIGSVRATKHYNVMGAAKAALEANVRYLAMELGGDGIRVNAVSPGPIRTLSASGIKDFLDLLHQSRDLSALKRNVTQEEVAHAVAFLASPQASGITGQTIFVDGGFNIFG